MARIPRKAQLIFASGAVNNGQFGSAQLGTKVLSTDLDVLQALAAYLQGWNSATIGSSRFPPLEEFQSLNYINTTQLAYIFQEGIPEWNTATTYYQKSIVKKTGTYELYGSKIDNNVGNALPVAVSDANWLFLQDISSPPVVENASETVIGVSRFATAAEAAAGVLDTVGLTPEHFLGTAAAEGQIGTAAVATQATTNTGTNDTQMVTPKKLAGRIATETLQGVAEIATAAEALALVNDTDFITPAKLALVLATINQVPIGTVQSYAGSVAPTGWMLCYGQAINRTTYANLFAVVGVTYGIGDGTTTFNLPDLRGRVAAGKDNMGGVAAGRLTGQPQGVAGTILGAGGGQETHVLVTAEMPSHNHTSPLNLGSSGGGKPTADSNILDTVQWPTTFTGGDGPHNNVQPTIVLSTIIKF